VATPVEDVLRKARHVADGDPRHCFGLSGMDRYDVADVLEEIEKQFGWAPSPTDRPDDPTYIDPDLVLAELDRAAERLERAGRQGERILLATGHPTGLLGMWQQLGLALQAAGAKLLRPADGINVVVPGDSRRVVPGGTRRVRYVLNVAVLSSNLRLFHTHDAEPMVAVLDHVEDVDLVLADHGWAGAAVERGIDVVSVADVNDPALPMAKAEGRAGVVIGMDDNVLPSHYDPVAEYLTAGLPKEHGT
jgi:Phosphatase